MTPKKLHRSAAYLETFTWTFLIIGMILKYSGSTEAITPIAGGIHGFGFLCFVVMTSLLWINNRWPAKIGLVGLVVSVIPFAALPFAIWSDKKGYLDGGWRFGEEEANAKPQGPFDWILAQTVRHTFRTVLVVLVIITIVFSTLLALGPPIDVESAIESR